MPFELISTIQNLGHYAVGDYVGEEALNYLQLMYKDLYYEYCVAMMYKTWPFKTAFDLLVLHVAESGIQKYWEQQVSNEMYNVPSLNIDCKHSFQTVAKHGNSKIQLGISLSRHGDKTGIISLGLDHVSGAFSLLGIGMIIGAIAFTGEMLYHRFKQHKKGPHVISVNHLQLFQGQLFSDIMAIDLLDGNQSIN